MIEGSHRGPARFWTGLVRLLDRVTLLLFNPPPVMISVARHRFEHRDPMVR